MALARQRRQTNTSPRDSTTCPTFVRDWKERGLYASDTPKELALRAAKEVDSHVRGFIGWRVPFLVETVLSSGKYQADVDRARSFGLLFWLVYVTTLHPELNVDRVQQRVKLGGHDVPRDSIIKRWDASVNALPWFAARADKLIVIDNSGTGPVAIATRKFKSPLEFTGHMGMHSALSRLLPIKGELVLPPLP